MDDSSDRELEVNSKKDARFTLILMIGCIFLFCSIVQIVDLNKQENSVSLLQISQDEQKEQLVSSIPSDLTFFFFKKLPINIADKDSLITIKGIGPKLAERILQRRLEYGPFKGIADLQLISGVGPKRAEYFETVFDFAVINEH